MQWVIQNRWQMDDPDTEELEMSLGEEGHQTEDTRNKIQNWLTSEGWKLSEQIHPEAAWLIRAEDAGGRKVLIGQNRTALDQIRFEARVKVASEHREQFDNLPDQRKREILWNLRFRLLSMNVDFSGVGELMESVVLTQRIYLDGLTKDTFIQRFSVVRNAIIAVIWSITQDLEGVQPPAASDGPMMQ
ncbi:MAG: DUF2299 family protein [Deltaproteobacteria bacterium]|nr:MAG: DUF2299 family protein [Deltaproteobacteria bacterium]